MTSRKTGLLVPAFLLSSFLVLYCCFSASKVSGLPETELVVTTVNLHLGIDMNKTFVNDSAGDEALKFVRHVLDNASSSTVHVSSDPSETLQMLQQLYEQGVLSDQEFQQQKEKIFKNAAEESLISSVLSLKCSSLKKCVHNGKMCT